jgi:hypothetical protein
MAKRRRLPKRARDRLLNELIGKALLTAESTRAEFVDRLVDAISQVGLRDQQGIISVARTFLATYEPLLAEHLSNTMILAWLEGYIEEADNLPPIVAKWMRSHAFWRQTPPEIPGIFGTGRKSPREVRFPKIEKATESLFNRGLLTRPQYDRLSAAAKQATFTVAWIDDTDVIGRIRDALAETITEGATLDRFRAKVVEKLNTSPMGTWHSETVYRTNLMSAFRDGRESLAQNPIVQEVFPFRAHYATHDGRVRDEHLALETQGLDGTNIYWADDPIWDYITAPIGYNCRCLDVLMRTSDAARYGVTEAKEWLRTGVKPEPTYMVDRIKFRPEPGFGVRHGPLLSAAT